MALEQNELTTAKVLSNWALIGLFFFLCSAWVLPSNKLYHQMIIVLVWLPALLALFRRDFYRRDFRVAFKLPEVYLFSIFAGWTLFVLSTQGADDFSSQIKVPFYVTLTLLGVALAAQGSICRLETLLFNCAFAGGFLAGASWISFYWIEGHGFRTRLVALGLWDTPIMAAHAVGALALLGVCLIQVDRLRSRLAPFLLLSAVGYVLFLGFSQTRGVWIALLAALLMMVIALRSRWGLGIFALIAAGLALVALLHPEILLQRGFSYRPTLWRGGLRLIQENWLTGLGFHEFKILVPAIDGAFKHPHNLFLNVGVRLGVPGLLLFCLLWLMVGWRAWTCRRLPLGRALLALWTFSGVALLTDGIGLWLKPNAEWLITWLPIALSIVLASRMARLGEALPMDEHVASVGPVVNAQHSKTRFE
ncbi:O-antigen ligase family protein [Pseudomonas sp. NPDC077382]